MTSGYLQQIYNTKEFKKLVVRVGHKIERLSEKYDFDAIAFRGTSGAAMAYPLSYLMNIPLICVRKSAEPSHGSLVEGNTGINSYLILDDLISEGKTIRAIVKAIQKENFSAECVGILLYDSSSTTPFEYRDKEIPVFRLP